jgi:hypothetical protein
MKLRLALPVLLVTLAGCAGSNFDIANRQERLANYAAADAGWVVASEGGEHGHFDASGITFQRAGSDDLVDFSTKLRTMFGAAEHDFESGSTIGKVQPRRLPPGDYEAVWAHGEQYSNGGWMRKPLAPGLRFTVKTGETVYIGRYVVGESHFTPIVNVSDHQDEDMAIAKARQPALAAVAATSQVPPPGQRRF